MPLNLTNSHFTSLQTPILAKRWTLLTHSWQRCTAGEESWEERPSSFRKKSPVTFQYLWSTHTVWNTASQDVLCCQEDTGDSRDGKWTRGFMRTEFRREHLRHGSSNRCRSQLSRPPVRCMTPSLTVNMHSSMPGNQRFLLERVQRWDGILSEGGNQGPRSKVGWVEQKATSKLYRIAKEKGWQ